MSELTPGALSAGQIFHGRYEIVRCLKAGGMGAVYECIHLKTRKHRALKVMLPQVIQNPGMRERFELEARVTAEIESEHIVETFDAGVDEATGAPFLVMELLRGEDLASVLKRRGPLPAGEVLLLLSQAALALDKTHAAGIVHRDLKPDNLYVTVRDDGSPRLKLLDFGIAKVVADGSQTAQQTAMIGTPLYMSQEQILGEGSIGPRADVYALGHIAFALLTGGAYWGDEQKASPALFTFLGKVMAGAIEPATVRAARRGVVLPAAFDAWFERATAKFANHRFERASGMVQELAGVLGGPGARVEAMGVSSSDPGVSASRAPLESMPRFLDSTTPLPQTAPASGVIDAPALTVGEGATVVVTSKSIGSAPRRSRLPVVLVVFGALGSVGVAILVMARMFHSGPSPAPSTASGATPAMAARSQPAPMATQDPIPAPTPSVTLTATSPASGATSASRAPVPPSAKPGTVAPAKPAATVKPEAPAKGCDPPYEIDGAGHRRMKPQCL